MKSDLTNKVLNIVAKIPKGKLMTYHQVAKLAGQPKAYRTVGAILNRNFRKKEWQLPLDETETIPGHRVIRSDGYIGSYALGKIDKVQILISEGHVVESGRIKLPKLVETTK
jgi:methylated-DNA-protein-cysteine methyltransferase-like protein